MAIKRCPSFSSRPGFPNGLRVLLVDADAPARHSTEDLLRELSYQVTTCATPAEALASLESGGFDVLLADSSMVSARTRERMALLDPTKQLPIILMADNPSPGDVMAGIDAGAVDFLAKPLSLLKLRNIWQHTVRRMMAQMDIHCGCSSAGAGGASSALARVLDGMPSPTPAPAPAACAGTAAHAAQVAVAAPGGRVPTAAAAAAELAEMEQQQVGGAGASAAAAAPAAAAPAAEVSGQQPLPHSPSSRSLDSSTSEKSAATAGACGDAASGAATYCGGGAAASPPSANTTPRSSFDLSSSGSPRKHVRRAVRHHTQASAARQPGPVGGVTAPPAPTLSAPLPPGGPSAALPPGMVWGMPMSPLAVAPGITPPMYPPPAVPPMPWQMQMCPPPLMPGFMAPAFAMALPPLPPAAVAPSHVLHPPALQPPPQQQQQQPPSAIIGGRGGGGGGAAPSPASAAAGLEAPLFDAIALEAISALDFEFEADDDMEELIASVDLKPADLAAAGGLPPSPPPPTSFAGGLHDAHATSASAGALAAPADASEGLSLARVASASATATAFALDASPATSDAHQMRRIDSASVLPSLESLFGLGGDECTSDLLPPLDAPLGLELRKTDSLADLLSAGAAC